MDKQNINQIIEEEIPTLLDSANSEITGNSILSVMETYDLSKMKTDRVNEYEFGDCWGKTGKYSLPHLKLVIDSMSCGEYGYTYSNYLLSSDNVIQVFYVKQSESVMPPEADSYFFVQQEKVINLNSDPPTVLRRSDTVYEYGLRENPIKKKFETGILRDKQITAKQFEREYSEIWERKSDF
ncbi:hypothetical protein [Christiangramia aquimixticola]|uniref:hypothetical protein n=1 Tax=Christiangramia aquimixticola TaxID=1697558 RepID=UPI003AA93BD4